MLLGDGGTSHAEILIKAEGWYVDQITLGVFRNHGPAALKDISSHLQRHLEEHRAI